MAPAKETPTWKPQRRQVATSPFHFESPTELPSHRLEELRETEPIPTPAIYRDVVSYFSPKSQKNIEELIDALSVVPPGQFSIDDQTQQVVVDGKPDPNSHITDILETINSALPPGGKDRLPPGIKETARILAENTNIPFSSITSPNIRNYIVKLCQRKASSQGAASGTSTKPQRQTEYTEAQGKWKDVSTLPSSMT